MMAERPLSPHLSVYKWAYTMSLSILHRATGMVLAFGLIALVAWLLSAALGADCYARVQSLFALWPFKVLWAGGIFAAVYHTCNGVRHLFWDVGMGFERAQARRSARIVVVVTVLATLVAWYFAFFRVLP